MTYCERQERSRSSFAKASFRWVMRGKTRILIACPKGKWNARSKRCRVGTRAYKVLKPSRGRRCPVGSTRIRK